VLVPDLGTAHPDGCPVLVGTSDLGVQGGTVLALNTWTFLAVTSNGSSLIFFVNGVQMASRSVTGNIVSTADPLRIGGDWSGEMFTGLVDNIPIYNNALTQTAIQSDVNAPGIPSPATAPPTRSV